MIVCVGRGGLIECVGGRVNFNVTAALIWAFLPVVVIPK